MKRKFLSAALAFLLACAISGCDCSHEWTQADCVHPQICTKCQEVGTAALGHMWLEATCTEAQTCSRCGASQGQALGHSYGEWNIGTDEMTRSCGLCGYEESAEVDRELRLESLLRGSWDSDGMTVNGVAASITDQFSTIICLQFSQNKQMTLSCAQGDDLRGFWRYTSFEETDAQHLYHFSFEHAGGSIRMSLTESENGELLLTVMDGTATITFVQNKDAVQTLMNSWSTATNETGWTLGDLENWLTFHEDRTVTGRLKDPVDGQWYLAPFTTSKTKFIVVIKNNAGATTQLIQGNLSTADGGFLQIHIGQTKTYVRSVQGFTVTTAETIAEILAAEKPVLGHWRSTYQCSYGTYGDPGTVTTSYSIDFHEDKTFTANLGKQYTGTWGVSGISDYSDRDWTNGNDNPAYYYYLCFDGYEEVGSCMWDNDGLRLTTYPDDGGMHMLLMQYSDDAVAFLEQGPTLPIGTWRSVAVEKRDRTTGTLERTESDAYYVTMNQDGTFTAMLDTSLEGTWKISYPSLERGSPWQYRLYYDDNHFHSIRIFEMGKLHLDLYFDDADISYIFVKDAS